MSAVPNTRVTRSATAASAIAEASAVATDAGESARATVAATAAALDIKRGAASRHADGVDTAASATIAPGAGDITPPPAASIGARASRSAAKSRTQTSATAPTPTPTPTQDARATAQADRHSGDATPNDSPDESFATKVQHEFEVKLVSAKRAITEEYSAKVRIMQEKYDAYLVSAKDHFEAQLSARDRKYNGQLREKQKEFDARIVDSNNQLAVMRRDLQLSRASVQQTYSNITELKSAHDQQVALLNKKMQSNVDRLNHDNDRITTERDALHKELVRESDAARRRELVYEQSRVVNVVAGAVADRASDSASESDHDEFVDAASDDGIEGAPGFDAPSAHAARTSTRSLAFTLAL